MPPATPVRWSFLAAIVGGLLFVASNLLLIGADYDDFARTIPTATFTAHTVLFWLAALLFLLALVGLYGSEVREAGMLGLVAFLVAFAGTAFALATTWSETFALAVLAQEAPALVNDPPARVAAGLSIAFPLFVAGWLLFAIASLRARVHPRAPLIGLLVGTISTLPAFALPGVGAFFGAAIAWLGWGAYRAARAR